MFRSEFAERETGLRVPIVRLSSEVLPTRRYTGLPDVGESGFSRSTTIWLSAPLQRCFDRIVQSHPNPFSNDKPIDHRFNRMSLGLLQSDRLGPAELDDFAIDPDRTKPSRFAFSITSRNSPAWF